MNPKQTIQLSLCEIELAKIRAALTLLAANSPDLELRDQLHVAHDCIDAAQDIVVALQKQVMQSNPEPSPGRIPPGEVGRILAQMEADEQ